MTYTQEIKLIIWDLDQTLWNGILMEGDVSIPSNNVEIIKKLSERGIINSISSKNDLNLAKEKLVKEGLWDYFVFPQICYKPKYLMIKEIISKAKLREDNTLFIDDEIMNLKEVKYYFPRINVKAPDFIDKMLNCSSLSGSGEKASGRLSLYKILEIKYADKPKFNSNLEFLLSCNIKAEIIKDCFPYKDRIFELINRTNQLNFTKIRLTSMEDLNRLLSSNNDNGMLKVSDKYGDYGICGFFSIGNGELKHFLLSCRLLNLGIEQWLYGKLGFPKIKIQGETAANLNNYEIPVWIKEKGEESYIKGIDTNINTKKISILIRGSCDLGQVAHYLTNEGYNITTEFNYNSIYDYPIHRENTEILYANTSEEVYSKEIKKFLVKKLPFYDSETFKTRFFSDKYQIIIMGVLMDYTQGIYSMNNNPDILVPFGDYNLPITDKNNWDKFIESSSNSINREFLDYFNKNFSFQGPESCEKFYSNLKSIRDKLNKNIPIIFINGCEVDLPHKIEVNRYERHISMNNILEKFIKTSENCCLLDVRNIVKSKNQLVNNIRHYNRESYKNISDELCKIIRDIL